MRTNSLGFASEIVTVSKPPAAPSCSLDISLDAPRRATFTRVSSNMMCCIITSLLLSAGVGIGVYYAVTEL